MQEANRQTQRSRTAREQIVRAALGVFALKGYVAASMEDISLAAGCSKGGLYHHFPSKGHVLSSVVKLLIELDAIMPPLERAAAATGIPAASLGRVLIEIWATAARDEELRAQLRDGYESRLHDDLGRGIERLSDILRIGMLIQMLTRDDTFDAEQAAARLGLGRAA